jgi:2Fe-2S ferredoxin
VGGQNPYMRSAGVPRPTRNYRLTIIDEGRREHVVEVDPARVPYSGNGQPGSILDIALAHDVELDHACGGVCACATCHIIVRAGLDSCNEPSEEEEDQLDSARGLTPQSRLACQCVPTGGEDVIVEIPAWNRNLTRERP